MALEITPTPILEGDAAIRFLKRLHERANKPARLVETPKLAQALERIRAASNGPVCGVAVLQMARIK